MSGDEVGYCKPPMSGRIKKGEVRNPNGRRGKNSSPKAPTDNSDAAIIQRIESEMVEANGREMSKREAAIRVLQLNALKGDIRAWQQFEALREKIRVNEPKAGGGVLLLPGNMTLEDWEASTAAHQAQFRERPNSYESNKDDEV